MKRDRTIVEVKIKGFKIVNFLFESKNRWMIFFFYEFQQIMAKIFTIVHSNQKWSVFTATLKDNHIHVVVDVRHYPESKTCAQFNKEKMIKALKRENVSYVHIFY